MARIAGIKHTDEQACRHRPDHIFGIGNSRAARICDAAGVKYHVKVKDLTDAEVASLRSQVAKFAVEGDSAPRSVDEHQALDGFGLLSRNPPSQGPAMRGQRTRTNARTRKGPRKQAVKMNAPPARSRAWVKFFSVGSRRPRLKVARSAWKFGA